MANYHVPVMLDEVLENLDIKPGSWYVDCNLGGGGHTAGILQAGGKVIGIDLDPEAVTYVAKNYKLKMKNDKNGLRAWGEDLILIQANFANIKEIISQSGEKRMIAGVLFDLGVSSHQLETPQRGFSFNQDAPLDMRMDKEAQQATAADLINGLHEGELAELFWKLGEENFARQIAKAIVKYRFGRRIETTNQLAQIILSVRRRSASDRTHPATRVFQALRIAVNDELNSLKDALPKAFEVLQPGGRLVVISFHSLEDREVKNFMKQEAERGIGKIMTKKPLEPAEEEVLKNPRARSGKLRALEKIKH